MENLLAFMPLAKEFGDMDVMQRLSDGGVFMYFILLFGVLTLSLIFERFFALYFKAKPIPAEFRKDLHIAILKNDFEKAHAMAKQVGLTAALGRIVEAGCRVRSEGGGDEEVQARMDERLTAEISLIDRKTGFLAMFGNVATLLGLLGTITGMIHSFAAVASASPADRATMLSKGISEAMNCTAFGLIVAIPALVAYALFQNKTDQLVSGLTESTSEIYHDLLFLSEQASVPSAFADRSYQAHASAASLAPKMNA